MSVPEHLILLCYDNLSLKKHIIGNNRVAKWDRAGLAAFGTGSNSAINFFCRQNKVMIEAPL